ncbi:MAG: F0F1 ATP synthase subunit delta [Hyphomicrobiales bacterium]
MAVEEPIVAGVAGRYATALFELAEESGKTDAVAADLVGFQKLLDESADLSRLVRSPVFTVEDQQRALAAVLSKAGIKGLTADFFGLVARNRRLFALPEMIGAFKSLVARKRGEISAEVRSATKLDAKQTAALKTALKDVTGQDVTFTTSVDPALLGGLVVKIGSRMIDTSLRTKLNNLKMAMKEVR